MKGLPIFNQRILAKKVCKGSAVIFPTDTLPAIGAKPENCSLIWNLKKRSMKKPLILMGSDFNQFSGLIPKDLTQIALDIAEKYWPGALTMILPTSGRIVDLLNPNGMNLGFRIPLHSLAREFLKTTGPLATTSANLSGESPSLSPYKISKIFPNVPILGPLPWVNIIGSPSTVITLSSDMKWQTVRQGKIRLSQ